MTRHSADASAGPPVVLLELNEADGHFLRKFARDGKLPAFSRVLSEGAAVMTRVPGWDAKAPLAWRHISPWIVWPSIYTGMAPASHGIVGFGQDTAEIQGRCVWDVLDARGISTGVFGSLMSHPPRNAGSARYYVPESLASDADCFPEAARPLQEFGIFAARHYSDRFGPSALKAVALLLATLKSGVSLGTIARTLWQVPAELLFGGAREPERAMLQSYMGAEAFAKLHRAHRPLFATCFLNHVAYLQHRYWRAAEPERYSGELSETDARFFGTGAERDAYERDLSHWVERGFCWSDALMAEVMAELPPGGVVLVATGLGQRPMDPVSDIHMPVVRLSHERELFDAIGLRDYEVLHQMNPDVTVNLADAGAAAAAEPRVRGLELTPGRSLFTVHRRGAQLFLELDLPRGDAGAPATLRHRDLPDYRADLSRYLARHPTNDQSTAHHTDAGLLLAWRKGGGLSADRKSVAVTDVAPTILSFYGIEPQPWMEPTGPPAFALDAAVPARGAARA